MHGIVSAICTARIHSVDWTCHMRSVSMNKPMKSPSMIFCPFLLLGLFTFSQSTPLRRNVSYSDEQALLQFKAALAFVPYSWTRNTSFCEWKGITCSRPPMEVRVVGLRLYNMGLERTISPVLGSLSALRSLDLSHNYLGGNIPPQLGNLPALQSLNLSNNALRGNIPPQLGNLSALQSLDLSNNYLGNIPPQLGNLYALQWLFLSHNALLGNIPPQPGNLSALQWLDLSCNFSSGSIPMSFKQLTMLTHMNASFNNLTGYVGEELFFRNTIVVQFMGNPALCGPRKYLLPTCANENERKGKKSQLGNKTGAAIGVIAFILLFNFGNNMEKEVF